MIDGEALEQYDSDFLYGYGQGLTVGKWQLVEHMVEVSPSVPASLASCIDGQDDYFDVWIGNHEGEAPTDFYLDDLRFYPADALATTYHYDSRWLATTLSVDPNNQPSRRITYDGFGRPVKWEKIDRTKTRGTSGADVPVMEKRYHLMHELPPGKHVQVNIPDGGQTYSVGDKVGIHWVQDATHTMTLWYWKNTGAWESITSASYEAGYNSCSWTIPADAASSCKVKLSDGTNIDESDRWFTVN